MPRPSPEPHVGRRIRQLRLAAGLTQGQVAERVDAAPETMSRIERGRLSPSVALLSKIAAAVGVTIDEIVSPKRAKGKPAVRPSVQRVVAILDELTDSDVDAIRKSITALLGVGRRIGSPR